MRTSGKANTQSRSQGLPEEAGKEEKGVPTLEVSVHGHSEAGPA